MKRMFCLKCCKLYENVERCTLHPNSRFFAVDTGEDFRKLKAILIAKSTKRSKVLVFTMRFYLICIYLLAFFFLFDGLSYLTMLMRYIYDSISTASDLVLVLIIFFIIPLLVWGNYFSIYIWLFPILYVVLFAPTLYVAESLNGMTSRLPFVPVFKDWFLGTNIQYSKLMIVG